MALKSGMAADEIARRLGWIWTRVPGLAGINNHEGSPFTADSRRWSPVVTVLAARHLFFSIPARVRTAGRTAGRGAGVMTAGRDVFLDDDVEPAAVSSSLRCWRPGQA